MKRKLTVAVIAVVAAALLALGGYITIQRIKANRRAETVNNGTGTVVVTGVVNEV